MAQSLPSTSSTWSLATSAGDADGDTEFRPHPHRQDELNEDESGPQEPSVGRELRGRPKHAINDLAAWNGKSSLQPEDKPSLFKRVIRKAGKIMKSKLVLAL